MKRNTSIAAAIITAVGGITAATISVLPQANEFIPNILTFFNQDQKSSVTFVIHNTLGTGQLSEAATISINGESVGRLSVNTRNPDSFLRVTVPQAGQHSYSVSTSAVFEQAFGRQLESYGAGQGFLYISGEETFNLVTAFSGARGVVSLQKASQSR